MSSSALFNSSSYSQGEEGKAPAVTPQHNEELSDTETAEYDKDLAEIENRIKNFQNFFEIFGLSQEATEKNIKKACNQMLLHYHPDKIGDDAKAATTMQCM